MLTKYVMDVKLIKTITIKNNYMKTAKEYIKSCTNSKWMQDNPELVERLENAIIDAQREAIKADRENLVNYTSLRVAKHYIIDTPNIELL